MFHSSAKRGGKKNGGSSAARDSVKVAICTELPESLKIAMTFFSLSEEDFRLSSPSEIKKVRLRLSAEKERREKQIQREKEIQNLLEILHGAGSEVNEVESNAMVAQKNLKQLKGWCTSLCCKHYARVYGHIQ